MRTQLLTLPLIIQISISVFAQPTDDQKSAYTKIAYVLATLPAQNKAQLNKSMESISALGEKGMVEMISMLSVSGDNTSVQYALAGYSSYVIQPGKELQRQTAVRAYCSALEKLTDNTNKQFIIYQLQEIGKDDAVSCIKKYLSNQELSGPAARALAQINTPKAQKSLLNALSNTTGSSQLSVIEAIGYTKYKPSVPSLISTAKTSQDEQLLKVTLYALAPIGDPAVATILQSAAQKAKYSFENTEATSTFLLYLEQLAKNGNKTLAEKLTQKLMQDAAANNQLHIRISALKLLLDINGSKSLPLLYAALKDQDIKYRAAALQFASRYQNAATDQQWMKVANTVSPEAQVQIIAYLSQFTDKNILPGLKKLLQSKNESVRIAAITAIAKIDQQRSLPLILAQIKNGNPKEIEAIKNAILLMRGDSVTRIVANRLMNMPSESKVALLEVLQARAADHAVNEVLGEVNNSDTSVHKAAVRALPAVATATVLPKLFELLDASKPDDIYYFQQSIINASAVLEDTLQRTNYILKQMNSESQDKKWLYFDVLAAIGGDKALKALQTAFNNGDEQIKNAAVTALSKATGANAARHLIQIASTSNNKAYKEIAISGYIGIIQKSTFPADQKLLMLEEAMQFAQTDQQRKEIIAETGNVRTFLSLIFAGKYLDDSAVQEEAAQSVMNIALSDKTLSGEIVKSLLTKTMEVLKGRDADYQRQAIQKYLSEMPPGEGYVALFNGKDLTGWKGLVGNPIERSKMTTDTLAKKQEQADKIMRDGWSVKDGLLVFNSHGENLCTVKQYGDFDMYVDWKITKDGDAGIYLRGSPQVQIWDTSRVDAGAQVGSGGLYNNQKNPSKPLVLADNAIGEWNTFHILMKEDTVTVYLNGQMVTDNIVLENYWDRNMPIFPKEQIELQAHGTYVAYRNIFLREF